MDTSSQFNIIAPLLVERLSLTPAGSPTEYAFDGIPLGLTHECLVNSDGAMKDSEQICYGAKPVGYDLVLETLWLEILKVGYYD
jgi:hypothetical protein